MVVLAGLTRVKPWEVLRGLGFWVLGQGVGFVFVLDLMDLDWWVVIRNPFGL